MNGPNNDDFTRPSQHSGFNPKSSSSGVSYIDGNGQIIGELPPGYIVGQQFRVRNTLGEGGMSYVYLCDDISLNRQVALKMMRASAQSNEQAFMRFHREGQAVAMLSHNNVVKVHSLQFTEHDQPFLVMEVVQGVSLAQLLEISGPLKLPRALKFLGQICDGISHAHANGVIHRDLKLSNIMLINPDRSDERIKILDFGIAKVVNETSVKMTQTGEVFGSPAYMSPEQALGKTVDTKTDQYSLGCIAFELLTGRTPFTAENHLAVLMAHVQEKAPSINEFMQVPVPANIEHTIARLLAKEPQDRFASIDEVKKALTGEMKVSKPLTVNLKKRINFRYVAYAGAFLLCVGIITAIAFAMQAPKTNPILSKTETLRPTDNLLKIVEANSDDGILFGLAQRNHYRTEFNNELNGKNITDIGLDNLRFCPDLTTLSLESCRLITSAGIDRLVKLQLPLVSLNLNRTRVDDAALLALSKVQTLQILAVENVEDITEEGTKGEGITDKGISYLTALPNLSNLSISDLTNLTAESLKSVSQMKNLWKLEMNNDPIALGLNYLANTKLTWLSMSQCSPQPQDLLALTKIHSLQTLRLDRDYLDENTILKLAKLPHLKELSVKGSAVSQSLIDNFHKLNPHCKLVHDSVH